MERDQLLNCLWQEQKANGFITDAFVENCSSTLGISTVEMEGVISFYHFFHRKPAGKFTIYLNNSIISEINGFERVKAAFERETGTKFGSVDPTGNFGLFETSCIGLSDVEPAALINFYPFTNLNSLKVRKIIAALKNGEDVTNLADEVEPNVRFTPANPIYVRPFHTGNTVFKLPAISPQSLIAQIEKAKLCGMGGAFFPTHKKLKACAVAKGQPKYVVCNADEGEPGTFKDRLLLQQYPELVLEGIIAAGYTIGASKGYIYLRAEYTWLLQKLQKAINDFRKRNFLGKDVAGIKGFHFDIDIQLGAGSYVCGEETAQLNSIEGKRGEPRTKMIFPSEKGLFGKPTLVLNVETLVAVARIIELGAEFFLNTGTANSPGTKLISISGDCQKPGIYEVEWGTKVSEILKLCKAEEPYFIQVSGPSGICLSPKDFESTIALDDIKCGGSFMIFNRHRDILNILKNFTSFFKIESCGICTPCRAGNFIVERKLEKIANGLAYQTDYEELTYWGQIMTATSRCGLGRSTTNAIECAIPKFPEYFNSKVDAERDGLNKKFNLEKALEPYEKFKD